MFSGARRGVTRQLEGGGVGLVVVCPRINGERGGKDGEREEGEKEERKGKERKGKE